MLALRRFLFLTDFAQEFCMQNKIPARFSRKLMGVKERTFHLTVQIVVY